MNMNGWKARYPWAMAQHLPIFCIQSRGKRHHARIIDYHPGGTDRPNKTTDRFFADEKCMWLESSTTWEMQNEVDFSDNSFHMILIYFLLNFLFNHANFSV